MLRKLVVLKIGIAMACLYIACKSPVVEQPKLGNLGGGIPVVENYGFETTPVWQDEFDYKGEPDPKKWGYDLGGNGWGNKESQTYTNDRANSRVEDGKLVIEAKLTNGSYTSARLVTRKKADFTYGKFVIRAKIPFGRGTWPAIWMLATDQNYGKELWPDNGEIDIMEHVGYDQNMINANIHTLAYNHSIGTNKGSKLLVPAAVATFHDYSCEWTPNEVKLLVDDTTIFTFRKATGADYDKWPFNKPFHLLLNIAIGGTWGGANGIDDSIFPQKMEVEYVRIYALKKL